MTGYILAIALLIGAIAIKANSEQKFNTMVDEHVKNLLKGGLIPRAGKEVHLAAMKKIGTENPHIKLPRREYY